MSYFDNLLKKFNSDLEYKALNEIFDYVQPTKYIVKSTNYSDDFSTPVLTAGKGFILGYTNETEGIFNASKENPVIIFDDFTTSIQYVDFPFKVKSSAMKILVAKNKKDSNVKYLFYAMKSIDYKPTEHTRQWISTFACFEVPVPNFLVQCNIVERLNVFESLKEKLSSEIDLRKKQLSYYSDSLMNNNLSEEEQISLGSLMIRKKDKASSDRTVTTVYSVNKNLGIVPSDDLHEFSIYSDDVSNYLIVRHNEFAYNPARLNIGSFAYLKREEPGLVSPMYIVFAVDESKVRVEYFKYLVFSNTVFNEVLSSVEEGARFRFDFNNWDEIFVTIPSLEKQDKIIEALKAFETLITEKIPLENALREKQFKTAFDSVFNS